MFAVVKALIIPVVGITILIWLFVKLVKKTDLEIQKAKLDELKERKEVLGVRAVVADETQTVKEIEKEVSKKEKRR